MRNVIRDCCISAAILMISVQICYAQEITAPLRAIAQAEHTARLDATIKEIGYGPRSNRRTGDLDMMEKSRTIRVLTVYGLGQYYLDGPE